MNKSVRQSTLSDQPAWLKVVREKVETLRFGVVQLIVHDGRVTQIERTEKTRLDPTNPDGRDPAGTD